MTLEDLVRSIVRDELAKAKPATSPDHVTVAQFARSRSISESTVRTAIRERRLAAIRIGRAVRVPAHAQIAKRPANVEDVTARARLVLLGGERK